MAFNLIAEFGNNHFGDFAKAKTMILAALESGATLAKGQAFLAKDLKSGSMPREFYKQCQFTLQQYVELIEYGREIGIPVFFSIFSKELSVLEEHQQYYKLSGRQTLDGKHDFREFDVSNAFVSIPATADPPYLKRAQPLYVSDYLAEDPGLHNLIRLKEFYKRPVGYSDHTLGITQCKKAIDHFDVPVIEKHFTLDKSYVFGQSFFRDCAHGIGPDEFLKLSKYFHASCKGLH